MFSELEYLQEKINNSREHYTRVDNMRRYLTLKGVDTKKMKCSQIVAVYYKTKEK